MIKDCKKGGLAGKKAKTRLKFAIGALGLLLVVIIACICTGGVAGVGLGVAIAAAPVAFAIPEYIDLSDSEKKGMKALADYFTSQFSEFTKNSITEEVMLKRMEEKLNKWGEDNGISKEVIEKYDKVLKEQGKQLASLKEGKSFEMRGLKGLFMQNFDALKEAIKNEKSVRFKAEPHVSDDALIEDRTVITTTTGANLIERNQEDPELYLKRRDRQYIEDIADVSVVAEVPETYTFDEEGDETGAIAIVEENEVKPQVRLQLIKNKVEAKKAAGFIVVTEELMKWRSRAWNAIRRLFQDKVMRDYENIITDEMITEYANQYLGTSLDGTITDPTNFDAIIAAILQLEALNFVPDTLVLNPADKWRLAMTTTANGMFILPYIQNGGQFALLGLRVITTNKIPAGTFELAESGIWKIEREQPSLRTGLVNDDLIHNRMTIVGEIFFLSYVPSNLKGGFIRATFADVKEALKAA